ncbi:hypothetical protein [Maridesulfovibrio sp.]|uniref:hypothetical protein n=1 Tax=Maridesulfovibrio sp. TaxID=2795000 RepID=UPI0029C9FD99|nr:hypothetical protein [Maridesulfovibrio sp.]
MWKSIIITTALLFFGTNNVFAADFGYVEDAKPKETQTVLSMEKNLSLTDFITGLNITDEMSTNLIFGLDDNPAFTNDGPDAPPSTIGIGLGFSFSF